MVRRALILGGGGVGGIAWLNGLLVEFWAHGFHPDKFELIAGTSAGASVAVQIASGLGPQELFERQVDPAKQANELVPERAVLEKAAGVKAAIATLTDPAEIRRRRGAAAISAATIPEADRRAVIASRLPVRVWPRAGLVLVSVDAESGEAAFFDQESGVDLVDAVTASSAVPGVWPPTTINGRRYVDGAVRSPESTDLAKGFDRVLVISPVGENWPALPPRDLMADIEALRGGGSQVILIQPDELARPAMGESLQELLDPATREKAAHAGRAQALRILNDVASIWAD